MSYRSFASNSLGSFKGFHACSLIGTRPERYWRSLSVRSSHVAAAAASAASTTRGAVAHPSESTGAAPLKRAGIESYCHPPTSAKSNRQLFREVPVPPSVLEYIQRIGVGIPSRTRRPRKRLGGDGKGGLSAATGAKANFHPAETPPPNPPPPFGPSSRVRSVAAVSSVAELLSPLVGDGAPEVALVGRSNVGKSTLLNALLYGNKRRVDTATMRRGVGRGPDKASMSPRPGETRQITLYHISSPGASSSQKSQGEREGGSSVPSPSSRRCSLRVVDLPGYGFAYSGPKDDIVRDYLLGRDPRALKRLLLLLDARHGFKQSDAEFLRRLQLPTDDDAAADGDGNLDPAQRLDDRSRRRRPTVPPIQIVLTKCDLVPQVDLARRVVMVRQRLAECLRREAGNLPVMLVAARSTLQLPPTRGRDGSAPRAAATSRRDGVLELQRELAALVVPTRG